jgi:hypothetical protein
LAITGRFVHKSGQSRTGNKHIAHRVAAQCGINNYLVYTQMLLFQSCIKAFEFIGYLREKDQKWQEAAANYEEAWRLTKRRNPTIGQFSSFIASQIDDTIFRL